MPGARPHPGRPLHERVVQVAEASQEARLHVTLGLRRAVVDPLSKIADRVDVLVGGLPSKQHYVSCRTKGSKSIGTSGCSQASE
jgi:hypothetical protein